MRIRLFHQPYIIVLLMVLSINDLKAQNHFYTTLKMPLIDYIGILLESSDDDERWDNYDGVGLDAGYGIKLTKEELYLGNLYLQTGISYLFEVNRLSKDITYSRYEQTLNNEWRVSNSAFSFQVGPHLRKCIGKSEDGETTFLLFGAMLNFRKLYSNINYTKYETIQEKRVGKSYADAVNSKFNLNIEPQLRIVFTTTKKLSYTFAFNYNFINWNTNTRHFSIPVNGYKPPDLKTSNLFFTAGFEF